MSYFLGFITDQESKSKIRRVLAEVDSVFNDFDIPVRWVKPNTFHITLYYLGEKSNFIKEFLLKRKISKIKFEKIKVSFNSIKVGISRNYKELVYLDLKEGGEELRKLLLQVRGVGGKQDTSMFVPHLTIGRVSKELSKEEHRNISNDVSLLSKKLELNDIHFTIDSIYLIESKNGDYLPKMKVDAF
ncbi:2'-5' RNA ligase family protein [Candidatus Dojkabacteria bacterium]|nr:2'-5' RNA ligase family protein [Candidatus Dojkabacteria bacterium]